MKIFTFLVLIALLRNDNTQNGKIAYLLSSKIILKISKKIVKLLLPYFSQNVSSFISKYFNEKSYETGGLVQISNNARGIGLISVKRNNMDMCMPYFKF